MKPLLGALIGAAIGWVLWRIQAGPPPKPRQPDSD